LILQSLCNDMFYSVMKNSSFTASSSIATNFPSESVSLRQIHMQIHITQGNELNEN